MTNRRTTLDQIALLLSSFPPHQGGAADLVLASFLMAIEGEPHGAVERAVRMFIRGEVDTHDRRFAPTSAQFAAFVRERAELMQQIADSQKSIANGLARPALLEDGE